MATRGRAKGRRAPGPMLFGPEEMRASPPAPGGDAAVPPHLLARDRARRVGENVKIMDRLAAIGAELAQRFSLRYVTLEAEREGVKAHYGICYRDGTIRIRLRHAVTRKPLKESSLVDTLCHELAHLKHFDHSPRFKLFYQEILAEARRRGYYRPGPGTDRGQLALFDDADCGTDVTGREPPGRGGRGR